MSMIKNLFSWKPLIGFAGILIVFALFGSFVTLMGPVSYSGEDHLFEIEKGESVAQIAKNLKEADLIKSEFAFKFYARLVPNSYLQAGSHTLSPDMTVGEVFYTLTAGQAGSINVTIPEGWTIEQIADRLAARNIVTKDDFITATNEIYDYSFLANRPKGKNLEGFLFPDTYNFGANQSAEKIVITMLDNFAKKSPAELSDGRKYNGLNNYQLVIMASLVEEEGRNAEERKMIAGVLYNRLNNGIGLGVDATIRYLTNNWTGPITKQDLDIDSPYNTRKYRGLPPTPIANAGTESLEAAINPTDSDYFYYLTGNDGMTYYAKTLDEHNLNKARYLN